MTRAALEHIRRAASAITCEREFIVIGSQVILGQFPHAPAALLVSTEADLYPRYASAKSDLIDAAIGEPQRGSMPCRDALSTSRRRGAGNEAAPSISRSYSSVSGAAVYGEPKTSRTAPRKVGPSMAG